MRCTNTDCGRETSIFLCTKCIVELDDLLSQVPLLVVALDPGLLANKVTKPPGANGETRNTNKAGSQAPMNVDVDQLRDWLRTMWNHRAYDIATNYPDAGHWLFMARLWVDKANTVTHGPEEIRVIAVHPDCGGTITTTNARPLASDHNPDPADTGTCQGCDELVSVTHKQTAERAKKEAPAMITRQLIPWLRDNVRISITRADINNWRQRGWLHPVTQEPSPTYYPTDVINVYQQKGRA